MKNKDLATVIGLITGRAEALADGNAPMAREYQRLIGKMNVSLDMPDVDPQTANAALVTFKSTFDPKQVARAKRVEVWGTLNQAEGTDFTLHVLIGADGRVVSHRKVNGY